MASLIFGECTKDRFVVIKSDPNIRPLDPVVPTNPLPGCCSDFVFQVLADNSGNELSNDINTIIYPFEPIVNSASMVLKKWEGGAWVDKATIVDDTYGKFNPLGFYTNRYKQIFISFQIEWAKVLAVFDSGSYMVTTTYSSPLSGTATIDSYEFCLSKYMPYLADTKVKLEYWLTGSLGDPEDDTKRRDFGTLNVYNSFRVKGVLHYLESSYEEEDTEYNNGEFEYVEDFQLPIYRVHLFRLPFFMHEIIRTDVMMADKLAITDYNSRNSGKYVKKLLKKASGYKPTFKVLSDNFGSVELEFKPKFNRHRKLRP